MKNKDKLLEYALLTIRAMKEQSEANAVEKMLSLEKELGMNRKEMLKSAFEQILNDPNLQ